MGFEKCAVLNVMNDDSVVETVALLEQLTIIGRERCDIVLDDEEVSSSHCQIQKFGKDYHLFDLHSTNGTFVNGQRIVKSKLAEGDRLRIGKAEFLFALSEPANPVVFENIVGLEPENYPKPSSDMEKEIDAFFEREREEIGRQMQISLLVDYGDGTSEQINCGRELVLGRATEIGRFSCDDELSRSHMRIFLDKEASLWAEDLGSTNGVFVNGKKLGCAQKISVSDTVNAGKCSFKMRAVLLFS